MGHAHHFLSRLDRLALPHVELALSLYRDDERLRYVLEQSRLPEGAERVAISLDDPREGPFVLVTRTGRFVTCLGRGMRADDLPIISRGELDAISTKHGVWRDREEAKRQLTEPGGGAAFLLGRLLDAGPWLSREEFQALAALHPLLGEEYLDLGNEWAVTSRRLHLNLKSAVKKRGPRLRPIQLEQLQVYWKTFFAAGHLTLLSLVDEGETISRRAGGDERLYELVVDALIEVVLQGGIVSKTTRGAWALAQLGERWLPYAKRRLAQSATPIEVMRAVFTLLAIGAKHEALRAEVIGALDPVPPFADPDSLLWARYLCDCAVKLLEDVEVASADLRRFGTALAMGFRDHYPPISPYRYARPEDVPADIAFSEPFHVFVHFLREDGLLPKVMSMLVPAARAAPEQLYLPRRCVEFLELKWEPEHSLLLMQGQGGKAPPPAPRPTGPTRNGACPCGSGKKYKRCCGAGDAAP